MLSPKPHILVCAPSNAAVDELVRRVLDQKFVDGECNAYSPDILRIGAKSVSSRNNSNRDSAGILDPWATISLDARVRDLMAKSPQQVQTELRQANHAFMLAKAKLKQLEDTAEEFMIWSVGLCSYLFGARL